MDQTYPIFGVFPGNITCGVLIARSCSSHWNPETRYIYTSCNGKVRRQKNRKTEEHLMWYWRFASPFSFVRLTDRFLMLIAGMMGVICFHRFLEGNCSRIGLEHQATAFCGMFVIRPCAKRGRDTLSLRERERSTRFSSVKASV